VRELMLIGVLAALPASAIAQSACGGPRQMTICEAELYDAGVTWEGRAREVRIKFEGCLEKLKVRTSTVIKTLVPDPLPEIEPTWRHDAVLLSVAGFSGLGLGVVLGVLLGR